MTPDLDAYESAFDRAGPTLDPAAAWARQEHAVRRALGGPNRAIAWTLVKIALCIGGAVYLGGKNGWGIAFFLVVVVLRRQWRERRKHLARISAVDSAEELRVICAKQTSDRVASVLVSSLLLTAFAVLCFLTALIAWFLDRSPVPGVGAGSIVLLWVAIKIVFLLPRAARESAIFTDDEDDDDDDDEDEDEDEDA